MNWRVSSHSGQMPAVHIDFQRQGRVDVFGNANAMTKTVTQHQAAFAIAPMLPLPRGSSAAVIPVVSPKNAPHVALTTTLGTATWMPRWAAALPTAEGAGLLRLLPHVLPYAPRLLSLTTPLGWGALAVSVIADYAIKSHNDATAHAYLPVVEPPQVVGEIYPAHAGKPQDPLARPGHLPQVLQPGSDGYSVLNPQWWSQPLTGTLLSPQQGNPVGDTGYRQHMARPQDGIYLSKNDQFGPPERYQAWIEHVTQPEEMKLSHLEFIQDVQQHINANPGMPPRVVAQEIDMRPMAGRPYLQVLTYEPKVKVDGQELVIPMTHLTGFAHHGSRGVYDTTTGRLDLAVNSAQASVGQANHLFGSEEQQVQAVFQNLKNRQRLVNEVYLRLSSNQTENGRKFVDLMKRATEEKRTKRGSQAAHGYATDLVKEVGRQGMLKAVNAVIDEGFSVQDFVTDPYSGKYDPGPEGNADRWIVLRRVR